ncbi:MAG TPA: glutaredoxin domain-containing protein [Bacillota bacterium]|nr:glutaredoxin domain-containing protein [Bacillota bacterium]
MKETKVYVTSTCPYCVMLTNYLTEKNIAFREVNVENNPEEMQRVVESTGQMGVPQTEINGEWVLGFDPEGIQAALNK